MTNFDINADQWWDPDGIFKPLHHLLPLRLKYIHQQCGSLKNKSVLDIGCGGGLVAEALAKQGAKVTAIDISIPSIQIAQQHANQQGLVIDYKAMSIAQYFANYGHQMQFEIIICFDLLQHLQQPYSILSYSQLCLAQNGKFILSTINQTFIAYLMLILGAEKILKILPKGTNQYGQFIKLNRLREQATQRKLKQINHQGYCYIPRQQKAIFVPYCWANYFATFTHY